MSAVKRKADMDRAKAKADRSVRVSGEMGEDPNPLFVVQKDGGKFLPYREANWRLYYPIRVYANGNVYDDFVGGFRETFTRSHMAHIHVLTEQKTVGKGAAA